MACIGLNYRDHAAETGAPVPERSVVFMKDPSTVVGPFDEVRIPHNSVKTDWEVELGVVIGTACRYLDSPGDTLGLPDHPYLQAGDVVRLEIDGLGQAEQRFVAGP